MTKFIPCGSCQNGYIFKKKGDDEYAVKCKCLFEFQETIKLQQRMEESGIPSEAIDYSIGDYIGKKSVNNAEKLKKYPAFFSEKFKSIHLYIHGPNGTQKTTLARWIGREVLAQGYTVRYDLMNNIIKLLTKEGFEDNIEQEIEKLQKVDLLILDESFDKEKIRWYKSDFQMSFLDTFLRTRLEYEKKATIFISNKSLESIKESFNNSLYDLVRRNTRGGVLLFEDHYTSDTVFSRAELKSMWD